LQQAGSALLPSGSGLSSKSGNATLDKDQAMDHFVRDAELQQKIAQLDFQSAYQSDRKARSDVPLLAIACQTVRVGNLPPYMELQCSTGQSVKMALTGELIQALANMLQLATREANWDVAMTNPVQASSESASKPILH
jgi:molybdenum cofactor biosynthesis enzyme MoaA